MAHHTKDRGDIGLTKVIAALTSVGAKVALPISEHLPFDCIAISLDGRKLLRVSVKYRSINKRGLIEVGKRSCYADRHGSHTIFHKDGDYDVVAIYCPNTDKCYFVLSTEFKSFCCLRPSESSNAKFQNALRIFSLS